MQDVTLGEPIKGIRDLCIISYNCIQISNLMFKKTSLIMAAEDRIRVKDTSGLIKRKGHKFLR